jgi:hypothetical protein
MPKPKPHKPTDIINFKLRIRESLRRQLQVAADKNKRSMNTEIANRLADSFEMENVRTLDAITIDLDTVAERFEKLLAAPEKFKQILDLMEAVKAPHDAVNSPEKIRQIMNLMEGTAKPEVRRPRRTEEELSE